MKQILLIVFIIAFLPFVLLALWYVFETPDMIDVEEDYPVLDKGTEGMRA